MKNSKLVADMSSVDAVASSSRPRPILASHSNNEINNNYLIREEEEQELNAIKNDNPVGQQELVKEENYQNNNFNKRNSSRLLENINNSSHMMDLNKQPSAT